MSGTYLFVVVKSFIRFIPRYIFPSAFIAMLVFHGLPAFAANNCYIPASDIEKIAVLNEPRSFTVSTVAVAGPAHATGVVRVDITHESERLYLVLTSGEPVIWELRGDTSRVGHVVLLGPKLEEGIAAGVTGVSREKVTILDKNACLANRSVSDLFKYSDILRGQQKTPDAYGIFFSIPTDIGAKLYNGSFTGARVTTSKIYLEGPAAESGEPPIPQGVPPGMWKTFLRFTPGGIENLRGLDVVSAVPSSPYTVLPGWAGLMQLVMTGAIVVEPKQAPASSQYAGGLPQAMQDYASGMKYKIVKDIGWMPAGLKGGTAPEMVLAKGIPVPKGDYGHICLNDEETRLPVAGQCSPRPISAEEMAVRKALSEQAAIRTQSGPPLPPKALEAIRIALQSAPPPFGVPSAMPIARQTLPQTAEKIAGWGNNYGHPTFGNPEVVGESVKEPIWLQDMEQQLGDPAAVQQIVVGEKGHCALKVDGSVWCWAFSSLSCRQKNVNCPEYAKSALMRRVESLPPIRYMEDAGEKICGGDGAGKAWCWDKELAAAPYTPSWTQDYPDNPNLKSLAASLMTYVFGGDREECGLTAAGAVWCWGKLYSNPADTTFGDQLRIPNYPVPISLPHAAMSVSIGRQTCALLQDRTAWCWKSAMEVKPSPVLKGTPALTQVVSRYSICIIKSFDGSVWCAPDSYMPTRGEYGRDFRPVESAPGVALRNMALLSNGSGTCGIDVANHAWCWGEPRADILQDSIPAYQPLTPNTTVPMEAVRLIETGNQRFIALMRPGNAPTTDAPGSAAATPVLANPDIGAMLAGVASKGVQWRKPCLPAGADGKSRFAFYPVIMRGTLHGGLFSPDTVYKGFHDKRMAFDPADLQRIPSDVPVFMAAAFDGKQIALDSCSRISPVQNLSADQGLMDVLSEAAIYKKMLEITVDPVSMPTETAWRENFAKKAAIYTSAGDYMGLVEFASAVAADYISHPRATGNPAATGSRRSDIPAGCSPAAALIRNYLPPLLLEKMDISSVLGMSQARLFELRPTSEAERDMAMLFSTFANGLERLGDYGAALYLLQCSVNSPENLVVTAKALNMPLLLKDQKLEEISFDHADISGLSLKSLSTGGKAWTDVDASGADLTGANFQGTQFTRVNFANANLSFSLYDCRTKFDAGFDPVARHMVFLGERGCNNQPLPGSNLDGTKATECSAADCSETMLLKDTTLRELSARKGMVGTIACQSCTIADSNFSQSRLTLRSTNGVIKNTSFSDAEFENSICRNSKFLNDDFTGANLAGWVTANCSYDSATKWPSGFDPAAAGLVKTGD